MGNEDVVCWICHDEKPEKPKKDEKWVRPCKCSLECHEECLLTWIESQENQRTRKYKCPQCLEQYRIIEVKPYLFRFMELGSNLVEASAELAVPTFLILSTTASVCLVLSAYGAHTVYMVCGSNEAWRLFETLRNSHPLLWIGIPMIPVGLLVNKFATMLPFYFPIAPVMIIGSRLSWKLLPHNKLLILSALPAINYAYNYLWDMTLGRLESKWEGRFNKDEERDHIRVVRHNNDEEDEEDQDNLDGVINEEEGDEGLDDLAFFGENAENHVNGGRAQGVVIKIGSGFRSLVWTLLTPTFAALLGRLLSKSALFSNLFPQPFERTIAAGCAMTVFKDLTKFWYTYLKYYVRKNRRIA